MRNSSKDSKQIEASWRQIKLKKPQDQEVYFQDFYIDKFTTKQLYFGLGVTFMIFWIVCYAFQLWGL